MGTGHYCGYGWGDCGFGGGVSALTEKETMKAMRKVLSIALIVALIALSILAIEPTQATTTKPAVPEEFHITFSAHPYDIAPTYTTDPYTGEKRITEAGRHMENKTIEVSIKNQPFTPYTDENGNSISLYYNVSYKGRYEDEWHTLHNHVAATNNEYTVLSKSQLGEFPDGAEVEFRVQACIGYYTTWQYFMDCYEYTLHGETSGWSPVQTITIENNQAAPPPTWTPTPSTPTSSTTTQPTQNPTTASTQPDTQTGVVFGLDWEKVAIVGLVVAVAFLAVGMVVMWHKLSPRNKV